MPWPKPCIGLAQLAQALPSTTLEKLHVDGCDAEHLQPLIEALPPRLTFFHCARNPRVASIGCWSALAVAIAGRLRAIECINARGCSQMGSAGLSALSTGLPKAAASLRTLILDDCGIGSEGASALAASLAARSSSSAAPPSSSTDTCTGVSCVPRPVPLLERLCIGQNELREADIEALKSVTKELRAA